MAKIDTRKLYERVGTYDARGSNWLAKGNEYSEAGNQKKAEECYDKGQYWLDKSNELREKYLLR